MEQVAPNFSIKEFVSKEIYDAYGDRSTWFVNPQCWIFAQFCKDFFTDYFKEQSSKVVSVSIVINDWSWGGKFNWRCHRTVDYINKHGGAKLSQHIGGAANAIDFNVVVKFEDGRKEYIGCNIIREIIMAHEKEFMEAGLTTLEDGHYAKSWVHADFRFTGLEHIFIVKPRKK